LDTSKKRLFACADDRAAVFAAFDDAGSPCERVGEAPSGAAAVGLVCRKISLMML
jgi:hypothetical protein